MRKQKPIQSGALKIYGPIAERLGKSKFEERVRQLIAIKDEVAEETVEAVCTLMAQEDPEIAERVRRVIAPLKLSDTFFQSNRRQTRRAEAFLLAAGVTQVPVSDVNKFYEAYDGVDTFMNPEETTIVIEPQLGKWRYE